MPFGAWLIFVLAAIFEVGGDAVVRQGLRTRGLILVVLGMVVLGFYGLTVNMVKWDFSRLLGVYVGVFAVVSVLFGRFVFRENIPVPTWAGLGLVVAGGLVIQFGKK
ncbi:MAG: SMR family transporter [Nitrospiraceae bacterium]|nr:SMR family transporter [Nitrospiraceae bacterium]